MKVFFLAGLFPKELSSEIKVLSRGVIQNAANTLQWNLVKGLDSYVNLKIINLPFVSSYPRFYKNISIPFFQFEHKLGAKDINLGFINLPLIKHVIKYWKLKNELKKSFKEIEFNENVCILIYSIHSPFIKAAIDIKSKYPKTKICLIVPDLPQFMSNIKSPIYKLFKFLDSIYLNKAILNIDSFVLLSDNMASALCIPKYKPWVRIEGIFDPIDLIDSTHKPTQNKNILYSGTLSSLYGIKNLLNAFSKISNSNYRLWICGEGDTTELIKTKANEDSRIVYFGQISREKVMLLQKEATVLVNPRTSDGEFTKYSFPSKIMEYFASGTPCIMYKLAGIPEEYYKFCFTAKEESPEGLYKIITDVCEMSQIELNKIGRDAQNFIITNKNPEYQCGKIFTLINNQYN